MPAEARQVPAPFEQLPHTIDTRNISSGGAYNIENIGIFIWRLNAYRLSKVPVVQAPVSDRNRYLYLLDPLGGDTQLFTHPTHDEEVTHLAGPLAVAAPITRDMLARAFSDYYGLEKSLWLTVTDTSAGTSADKVLLPDPLSELVRTADALHQGLTAGRLDFQRLAQLSEPLDVPSEQRVDLGTLAAEVARQLEEMASARGVVIRVHPHLPVLHGDAARVELVFLNLVSNAIKYGTPDTPVRVALRGEEADIHLEVTNTGPPVEATALREIFDPLKRGMAPADREDRGSLGLGLFIVREIAHAHGGEVEVYSGGGETTFALRLPRHARNT